MGGIGNICAEMIALKSARSPCPAALADPPDRLLPAEPGCREATIFEPDTALFTNHSRPALNELKSKKQ
jgi:hypothetical protein